LNYTRATASLQRTDVQAFGVDEVHMVPWSTRNA